MRGNTRIAFLAAALCPCYLFAQINQNSFITTFAGAAWTFPGNGAAGKNAPISQVASLNTDNNGNVIFADPGNHVVSRINSDGSVTVIAGNGVRGFSGDGGPALSASLNNPVDAVVDSDGNLYISDSFNDRIRKVTPDGTISTLYIHIGGARLAILNNNIGARLRRSFVRTGSRQNNTLYNTDPNHCVIYQTTPDGTLSVFAGTGECGHSGDGGAATLAMINPGAGGIAVDYAGNVYVAESIPRYIRVITPDGLINTIAGNGTSGYTGDNGPALSASLNFPQSITFDGNGNLIFSDVNNAALRQIDLNGNISTIVGTGTEGYTGDGGPASSAKFLFPKGVTFDGNGNLVISDSGNFRIRSVQGGSSSGTTSTVVGNGLFRVVPDGTPAAQAFIFGPDGVAVSPSGNLLVTEVAADKVAQIGLHGNLPFQILAGNGASGANRGFPAVAKKAFLDTPRGIVADGQGNIYYSDNSASVVYKQTPDGQLHVFAGQPLRSGYDPTQDGGPATQALLIAPYGIALDSQGDLFIADRGANVIREVTTDGNIHTFAGNGQPGFSGDNGPAVSAQLNVPQNLAIDSQGDVLICDRDNNRIRIVTTNGNIATFAGTGAAKTAGDGGPATQASLNNPFNIALDSSGNVFVLEGSAVLRRIDTSGSISTMAGTAGQSLNSLDGTSAGLALLDVDGLAFDSSGNLYLASFDSDKIRAIFVNPPVFNTSTANLSFSALAGGTPPASKAVGVSAALQGFQGDPGAVVTISSDSPWLKVQNPFGIGTTPFNVQVQADPSKLSSSNTPYKGKISLSRLTSASAGPFAVIPVTFTVGTGASATLAAQPGSINASLTAGGSAQTQILQVLNTGGGSLSFNLSVSGPGASAVSLSIKSGVATAGTPIPVGVTINPSSLSAGAYAPALTISSNPAGQSVTVPITIIVAGAAQLALSQHGFLFTAVKGGGVTPKQPLTVLNIGSGTFQWSASAITLSGSQWLKISPSSGSSTAGSSSSIVTISVDPTKVSNPGVYYGIVRVTSPGTNNAPQDVEVVLNLLSSSNSPGAILTPAGMVFTAPSGSNPSSQTFTITNLNAAPLQFRINPGTFDGHAWLQAVPTTTPNPVPAGGSQTITVQPDIQSTNLPPGAYFGTATIDFMSQGSFFSRTLQVLLVVTGASPAGAFAPTDVEAPAASSNACKPTQLYPLFTSFVQDFSVPAAWPIPLEVKVVDNCGSPQTNGSVAVSFSNGDPLLSLQSLSDGRWQGTYFGKNTQAGQLTMGIHASKNSPPINGTTTYTGTLSNNTFAPPAVNSGGVGSAAVAPPHAPLAPGEIVTIQGANFAPGQSSAQLPLQTHLGGNGVFLAGTFLPLIYSSGGLITAVVPYNIKSNAQYLLLVNRSMDGAVSGPAQIAMTTAQPGIFLVDASGDPNMAQKLWAQITTGKSVNSGGVAPPNPVKAGDSLVIYCTGLGAVNGTVDVTQPAPANPPSVSSPVTVKIGGVSASVSFAGLASGVTGIYQVKITVPSGITPGSNVPLVVSTNGQSSMPVNLTVH